MNHLTKEKEMEKVEFKIPYTKFGIIFADKDGDNLVITGVSKDYSKKNIWDLVYKGYNLWKYQNDFAIYQQDKKFIGLGVDRKDNLVEVNFSKRPNRHVIKAEKPEGAYWSTHDIATYNEHHILLKAHKVIKRTQEEARIRAEKLLRKHAHENRAVCGACERYIERWDEGNRNGVIYDHGFKQVGFRAGTCIGARYQPWEKSPEGEIVYIKQLQSQKDHLLNNKPDEKLLAKLLDKVEKFVAFKRQLEELKKEHKEAYEEDVRYFDRNQNRFIAWLHFNKDIKITALSPIYYLDTLHVWDKTTVNQLFTVWQRMIDTLTDIINKQQTKVDNWEEQLTAKEKVAQS